MAFRSISTNATPATSLVVTPPSGIVDGDILVAWAQSDSSSGTCTFPAGFSVLTGTPLTTTIDGASFFCATKKAASESGNYTLTGSVNIIGGVAAFSGRHATLYLHRSSVGSGNTFDASPWDLISAAFPTPVSVPDCDLIFIGGSDSNGVGTVVHTAPSGLTNRADINAGAGTFFATFLASQNAVASGVTGAMTGVGTAAGAQAGYACVAIALAPAVTAALSGTATASIDETDIVAGAKTLVLTLTGDTLIPA